jgi:hypothetical protein
MKILRIVAVGALLAVASLGFSTSGALAYGGSAVYQIEISANGNGPGVGGGVWLWIELDVDASGAHTGDYTGADCVHQGPGPGNNLAIPDIGDITSWTSDGEKLTIHGVVLAGGLFPATITVPAAYGHYVSTVYDTFGVPMPGWSQNQVAP